MMRYAFSVKNIELSSLNFRNSKIKKEVERKGRH